MIEVYDGGNYLTVEKIGRQFDFGPVLQQKNVVREPTPLMASRHYTSFNISGTRFLTIDFSNDKIQQNSKSVERHE